MYTSEYTSVYEFYDLIEHTLSFKFKEKWKDLFSIRLIKLFQFRILKSLMSQKPLKKSTLKNYLINQGKYSNKIVDEFFESIDIELYYPFIH